MLRVLLYGVVAALTLALTAAVLAPAQWVASAIGRASGERVLLAEAAGSVWSGRAAVVLAAGEGSAATRVGLPELLSWRLAPWPLLVGTVDLTLAHPSALLQPLRLRANLGGHVELLGTTLRLPASLLVGLGAPFNTIKPGGLLSLSWQRLEWQRGRLHGDITGEWQFASSSLTPVAPFGHYRLQADGGYPGTRLQLTTLSGPLELTGDGTIDAQGRVRFSGRARAAPDADATTKIQLTGLVSLLGRRDGDSAILSLGP